MSNEKKKFYQKGWFLWLMLICFPPIGIILLWACHKKMNKVIKIVLTIIFLYWIYVLTYVGDTSETDGNEIVSDETTGQDQEETMQDEEKVENDKEIEGSEQQVENVEDEKTKEDEEKSVNEEEIESKEQLMNEEQVENKQEETTKEDEEKLDKDVIEDAEQSMDNKFVEDVKNAIQGAVGEDEIIEDVVYKNRDLCVYIDLSNADPSPLTYELLAEVRTSSITDEILDFSQYDDLWDTITVDFGSIGYIRNAKDNLMNIDSAIGTLRCFDMINFELVID